MYGNHRILFIVHKRSDASYGYNMTSLFISHKLKFFKCKFVMSKIFYEYMYIYLGFLLQMALQHRELLSSNLNKYIILCLCLSFAKKGHSNSFKLLVHTFFSLGGANGLKTVKSSNLGNKCHQHFYCLGTS